MRTKSIKKIQSILSLKKYENSYAIISTRQLNIFNETKERKKYINYLINYATINSNLSFIKNIKYKNQKTITYDLINGILNIPNEMIHDKNFVNYIPLILTIIEFKNIYFHRKEKKDMDFFNQLLFDKIKKIFKDENEFFKNKTNFDIENIHVDYIEKNAIEFLTNKTKENPIKVETPNIKNSYISKNLFLFQSDRVFVIKKIEHIE
jgi:hypothetical protein